MGFLSAFCHVSFTEAGEESVVPVGPDRDAADVKVASRHLRRNNVQNRVCYRDVMQSLDTKKPASFFIYFELCLVSESQQRRRAGFPVPALNLNLVLIQTVFE